nr:hypothetical protein [Tanacetum cinerariifolium]
NPTPSFDCKTKSSSTSINSFLEETNTFDNSLPEFETFCFDVEEISSGSTTTHPDISLPEYEVFHDDHVKELSSGKYDCFLFKVEPNSWDFTKDVVEDISPTKEPQVLNTLPTHPTLQLNMKFQSSSESLFNYVVKEIPRKGQNRIKTGQKREAWQSREKFKAVTVDRARKTEKNAKRMAVNANTVKVYSKFNERKKEEGPDLQFHESHKKGA